MNKWTWTLAALLLAPPMDAVAHQAICETTLNAVRENPKAFLKTRFEFEGRFDKLGSIYQPFFTMFDDHSFINFSAWDVRNSLSTHDGFMDNWPLLYMGRRHGAQIENLVHLTKFQRFRAIGTVQSIFGGHPFIEITKITRLDLEYPRSAHRSAAMRGEHTGKPPMQAAVVEHVGATETMEMAPVEVTEVTGATTSAVITTTTPTIEPIEMIEIGPTMIEIIPETRPATPAGTKAATTATTATPTTPTENDGG